MTKRNVLIPLDGSEFSRQIVRVVRSFFEPNDVRLILFRAAHPPAVGPEVSPHDVFVASVPMSGSYDSYSRALDAGFAESSKERETFRTQLMEDLRADAVKLEKEGYSVSVEVHFGDPGQRIIEFVNDEAVDLVAMATHGRSGIGRLVLGSVAERVLRGVTVPVLLMRSAGETAAEQVAPGEALAQSLGEGQNLRIAVATDGSTLARKGLAMAGKLAASLHAALAVLVVVSDREPAAHSQKLMEQVHELIADFTPRPEIVPLVGYADEVLLQHLSDHTYDLLIMGAFHDRGAGSTTAIGPTAQRLVQHAPTSVWMHKGHSMQVRRILASVAVDDILVVDVAALLAKALDAELTVVHVIPPAAASYLASPVTDHETPVQLPVDEALAQGTHLSTILQGWITQLQSHGFTQDCLTLGRGPVTEAILRMAHNMGYDLIVVGSQSGPGQFLGSVANGVVRYAEHSVLVVRTREN